MSGAPRPEDPALIYADFIKHQATCGVCTVNTHTACPYGEHLLEAWSYSERFYAQERRDRLRAGMWS